jgi:hypothetical protein
VWRFYYTVFSLIVALILAEGALRLLGYLPYKEPEPSNKITSIPGPLFCSDSILGYRNCSGKFQVTLNGDLTYSWSIDSADGWRTVPNNTVFTNANAPEIHIHGCSFFAGMGVNDDEVLSAYLQQLVGTNFRVVNKSIPGHGMTTQLRQLQQAVENDRKPAVAVFSIASFHLPRNSGAPEYLNKFQVIKDRPMQFLCSKRGKDGKIQFFVKKVAPDLLFGARHLATAHLLGDVFDYYSASKTEQLQLQLLLMDSAYSLASQNSIQPLFVLLTKDEYSTSIITHAKFKGYEVIQSEVDYNNTEFNLMPHDGHPNARAHKAYAYEVLKELKQSRQFLGLDTLGQ